MALDGSLTSLAADSGKVVVVNAWATWCLPCRVEMPTLSALADSVRGEGIVVRAISPETREVVSRWARAQRVTLPLFVEVQRFPAAWKLDALPRTWVLDRTGRPVFTHRGAARWDHPVVLRFLRAVARGEVAPLPALSPVGGG
jgi:thiol-disulfide isomerase/thioredoxin